MGLGGISIWQLLIVLAIVILIFGTKRLKGLGGDVGGAIKSFKKAVNEDDKNAEESESDASKASLEQKDADFTAQEKAADRQTSKDNSAQ